MSVEDSGGSWLIFMFLLILFFLELEAPTSSYSHSPTPAGPLLSSLLSGP